jgi:DNA polymerase III subunit beta
VETWLRRPGVERESRSKERNRSLWYDFATWTLVYGQLGSVDVKVSCLQETLQRALVQVSRAVATKTALPVLSNVLLSTDDGRLKIAATNLEIGITTWVPAAVEQEGSITVDARLLTDFINTLPNDTVQLSSDNVRFSLAVQCGRDKAAINGIDPEDFPVIPTATDDAVTVVVDPQLFRDMITQVELAAASDDSRPVLAGVLTRFEEGAIMLAAADGFRMAVRNGALSDLVLSKFDIIVPARAYRELARIVGDWNEPLTLTVTPNQSQLLVRVGQTEFLSRLIEGTFPDVRQIIPREFGTRVEVGREALISAVRRASYFARDNNDVIRILVKPGDSDLNPGTLEITATAAERGNSQSFVDATVTGPELQIAFNARYLQDVLGVIRQGQVMLGLNGNNQAGVVRPTGSEEYTHVIMPMVIGAN